MAVLTLYDPKTKPTEQAYASEAEWSGQTVAIVENARPSTARKLRFLLEVIYPAIPPREDGSR